MYRILLYNIINCNARDSDIIPLVLNASEKEDQASICVKQERIRPIINTFVIQGSHEVEYIMGI
jgi:hypothetical protein